MREGVSVVGGKRGRGGGVDALSIGLPVCLVRLSACLCVTEEKRQSEGRKRERAEENDKGVL